MHCIVHILSAQPKEKGDMTEFRRYISWQTLRELDHILFDANFLFPVPEEIRSRDVVHLSAVELVSFAIERGKHDEGHFVRRPEPMPVEPGDERTIKEPADGIHIPPAGAWARTSFSIYWNLQLSAKPACHPKTSALVCVPNFSSFSMK